MEADGISSRCAAIVRRIVICCRDLRYKSLIPIITSKSCCQQLSRRHMHECTAVLLPYYEKQCYQMSPTDQRIPTTYMSEQLQFTVNFQRVPHGPDLFYAHSSDARAEDPLPNIMRVAMVPATPCAPQPTHGNPPRQLQDIQPLQRPHHVAHQSTQLQIQP
jgi:hypothetical protein